MRLLEVALRNAWEFVVGDDWRTAVGVVATLALTAALAQAGVAAWWVLPVGVVALLALSIRRAMRLR
jgi:ABC-type branched-subunit amino acid transport system substrate-binding protein